jgi:hypothetical protein
MDDDIVESLVTADIQTVALEILARELSDEKIVRMTDLINEKIPWYDVIAEAIREKVIELNMKFMTGFF